MTDAWQHPPTPPPAPAGPAGKKRSGAIWTGVILMAVGLVLGIGALVAVMVPTMAMLQAPGMAAPGSQSFDLDAGENAVYERVANQFDDTTITPADVSVTAPGGAAVKVSPVAGDEILAAENGTYAAVARFKADPAGRYEVKLANATPSRVVVGPTYTGLGRRIAPWLLGGFGAGLLFLIGFVVWIVGLVRRPKAPRPPSFGASGYGPGPGGYAPGGYGPPGYAPPGYASPGLAPRGYARPGDAPPGDAVPGAGGPPAPAPPPDPWNRNR